MEREGGAREADVCWIFAAGTGTAGMPSWSTWGARAWRGTCTPSKALPAAHIQAQMPWLCMPAEWCPACWISWAKALPVVPPSNNSSPTANAQARTLVEHLLCVISASHRLIAGNHTQAGDLRQMYGRRTPVFLVQRPGEVICRPLARRCPDHPPTDGRCARPARRCRPTPDTAGTGPAPSPHPCGAVRRRSPGCNGPPPTSASG